MPLKEQDHSVQRGKDIHQIEEDNRLERLPGKNSCDQSLAELLDQEYRSIIQLHQTKQSFQMLSLKIPGSIEAHWLMYLPFAVYFEVCR